MLWMEIDPNYELVMQDLSNLRDKKIFLSEDDLKSIDNWIDYLYEKKDEYNADFYSSPTPERHSYDIKDRQRAERLLLNDISSCSNFIQKLKKKVN